MRSKIFMLSTIIILSSCTFSTSNQVQNTKTIKTENTDVKNNLTLNTTKKVEITILNPKDKSSVSWYKKDEENIIMKVGSQAELVGTVTLNNGTKSSNVNWASSDNTIALVNSGKITANKIGTTTIVSISNVDPSYKSILNVTVVDEANFSAVDSQSINKVKSIEAYLLTDSGKKQEIQLQVSSEIQSIAAVTLIDGTKNSNVIWESSDENIAIVNSDGKVTGKKIGFTTIVAKYKLNPDFKALINIEVINHIDLSPNPSPSITKTPEPKPTVIELIKPEISNKADLVFIEGDTFEMGDNIGDGNPNEKPIHTVKINSFYIGKYEVTQKEYENLMNINNSSFIGDNLPVENVDWFSAIIYCNKLSKKQGLSPAYDEISGKLINSNGEYTTDTSIVKGYRLPTEAEWEFAARGGKLSKGYKYSGENLNLSKIAWYNENSDFKTHEIGKKAPNELGLYDMSGNVWEWCNDFYNSNFYSNSSLINPYNSNYLSKYKVLRGGSFFKDSTYLRISNRYDASPTTISNEIGFRIVKSSN